MNTFTVSFFGHRKIDNTLEIESRLEQLIRALLREHKYVEFLVGRDGEFDQLASSVIHRCKREYRNEESFRDYYDEIEICEASAGSHYKNAYQARNRAMVDRSDLVVFCIRQVSGGAWQTMKYAKKQNKHYINLNNQMEEN